MSCRPFRHSFSFDFSPPIFPRDTMSSPATIVPTGQNERSRMIDWERVVRDDGPAAWRTACRILGNRQDAQECVQDAFAEAIELSRREAIGNCRALLLRVVTARS